MGILVDLQALSYLGIDFELTENLMQQSDQK